tara:strand:- start:572 stop:802 length:231 start_codon:yes stop_codon:yes gene_type:complete
MSNSEIIKVVNKDELDNKCKIYCNAFFNIFEKNVSLTKSKNECISECRSGKTYSSGTIAQQIGGIYYEIIINKDKR